MPSQVRIHFVADFGPEKGKKQPPIVLLVDYDTLLQKACQVLKVKGRKNATHDLILVLRDSGGSREIVRAPDGAAVPLGGALCDGAVVLLTKERPMSVPKPTHNAHLCIACKGSGQLLQELCPLCDGAGAFSDDEENANSWPDAPVIQGKGRGEGLPPRGAGIIALCEIKGKLHVCLCEKRNGNVSFPKGGLDGNAVLAGAKREWAEEAGLSLDRLQILRDASLDEARIGCRYLLGWCQPPALNASEPDTGRMEWPPPFEDPNDRDPIVKARWCPVSAVNRTRLLDTRRQLLEQAVEKLGGGGDFVPATAP